MSEDSGSASLIDGLGGTPQASEPAPAPAPAEPRAAPEPPKELAQQPTTQPPADGRFFLSDEDLKERPGLKKYMNEDGSIDVNNLAKGYVHAESLIGRDRMVVPDNDADDETWGEVYDRLGRPGDPSEYEIKKAELPEGIDADYSEDMEKSFRQTVHQAGLNGRQAQQLYDAMIAHRLEEISEWNKGQKERHAEGERLLRREQGANYDAFMNDAKRGFQAYADAEFVESLKAKGLENDPAFLRVFAKVGKELAGDRRLEGEPQSGPTPADLDREINDYITKYGNVLGDTSHPEYKARKRVWDDLNRRRYTTEAA